MIALMIGPQHFILPAVSFPSDASHLGMRDKPDENRRKSHKAVDRCDKQRHLGHLDVLG